MFPSKHSRTVAIAASPEANAQARVPPESAFRGVGEEEPLLRAGEAHIRQPSLLLDSVLVVQRPAMREDPLLEPGEKYRWELQPLGRMKGHQRGGGPRLLELVDVSDQRNGVEERPQVCTLRPPGELLGGDDQLVQVLETALGLGTAL